MTGWARLTSADAAAGAPHWVRAWSDALPFATGSFDAVVCKGALDHFDRPDWPCQMCVCTDMATCCSRSRTSARWPAARPTRDAVAQRLRGGPAPRRRPYDVRRITSRDTTRSAALAGRTAARLAGGGGSRCVGFAGLDEERRALAECFAQPRSQDRLDRARLPALADVIRGRTGRAARAPPLPSRARDCSFESDARARCTRSGSSGFLGAKLAEGERGSPGLRRRSSMRKAARRAREPAREHTQGSTARCMMSIGPGSRVP